MPKLRVLKKHNELLTEILVISLYIVAVIFAFWWLSSSHAELASFIGLHDGTVLDLSSIASILGIVAAAMAIIISNRQEAKKEQQSARDQIYQKLELESINLFRFEIENVKLARTIWEDEQSYEQVKSNEDEAYRVLQHLCQILNLFEMAVRFKHNRIAHEDVFNSWKAWIFDLCRSDLFLHYWYLEGIKENYIDLFQEIIDDGLRCFHGQDRVNAVLSQHTSEIDTRFETFTRNIQRHLED